MQEMGVSEIVANNSNTPVSNDQSNGGDQQVQNNAETPPVVETQTEQPPVVQETPPATPGQEESQTTNAPGGENNTSATPEASPQNAEEGEGNQEPEADPMVRDFFSEESEDPAQNSTGTPPATQQTPIVQPPVAQTQVNSVPDQFFADFNTKFGTDYKDQESLVAGYEALSQRAKVMDDFGVDPAMLEAINEGILTHEEIAAGGLLFEYGKDLTSDDMVTDMLLESNPNMTPEQLEEALDEMGEGQKIGLATQYAQMKNMKRSMAIQQLQGRLAAKKQAREAEALQIRQQKDQMASDVKKSIADMTEIAGTGLKVDSKMKQQLEQFAGNPDMVRQLLWGRGKNPDPAFFVQQIAKLAYAAKIANLANKQGKNEARRDLIQSTQNLDRNNNSAGMITPTQVNPAQEGLKQADEFFNS